MAVKHQTVNRANKSALVDKNVIIATVKRASRETGEREDKLTKDVRVATKNANSNDKSAEDRKKKAYDTDRHFQYLKDEMEDSRDKSNYLQVEVVNIQVLKRSIELIAGNWIGSFYKSRRK